MDHTLLWRIFWDRPDAKCSISTPQIIEASWDFLHFGCLDYLFETIFSPGRGIEAFVRLYVPILCSEIGQCSFNSKPQCNNFGVSRQSIEAEGLLDTRKRESRRKTPSLQSLYLVHIYRYSEKVII